VVCNVTPNLSGHTLLEWKRNLVAHGEAREEKWRGKRRMEWAASSLALYLNTVYPALLPLMRTPRLPAADWTDTHADINGLVRFAGRQNLVSARVPSHSVFTLPSTGCRWSRDVMLGSSYLLPTTSRDCNSNRKYISSHPVRITARVCVCVTMMKAPHEVTSVILLLLFDESGHSIFSVFNPTKLHHSMSVRQWS